LINLPARNSSTDHIITARLFDVAEGSIAFTTPERHHLRDCEHCQLILAAFVTRNIDNPPPRRKAATEAA
jgi:hypothetical protein